MRDLRRTGACLVVVLLIMLSLTTAASADRVEGIPGTIFGPEEDAKYCDPPQDKYIPGAKGISGVRLNGKSICFPDAQPGIVQNRTLIPVRFVSEALGAKVDWDGINRVVTITQPGKVIKLAIDQVDVTVNGQAIALDVPAKIYFDRTFVPLRFVSEALGVGWTGIQFSTWLL